MTINGLENWNGKIKFDLILFCWFVEKGITDTDFFVDAKCQTDTDYLFLTDNDMRYGYPLYGYWLYRYQLISIG